jgi:hypothetical protein
MSKNDNPQADAEVISFASWRLCEWCHDPDRPITDAEKHVKYHPACKAERTKQRNRAYYLANADQLRADRRLTYWRQKGEE